MIISTFNQASCRLVRAAIERALEAVEETHGISIKPVGGSFTPDGANFNLKLEMATKSADGTINSKEAADFKSMAGAYGLDPGDLGKTFKVQGEMYAVAGLKTRSRKYPILGKRVSDGKMFKFGEEAVARHLQRASA